MAAPQSVAKIVRAPPRVGDEWVELDLQILDALHRSGRDQVGEQIELSAFDVDPS